MRTVRHYDEADLEKIVKEHLEASGFVTVKSVKFSATERRDFADRPSDGYDVTAEVEVVGP